MKKTEGMQLSEMSKVFQSNACLNKSFYLDPICFLQHHNNLDIALFKFTFHLADTETD